MKMHANARLSLKGRELLIERVERPGWSLSAAGESLVERAIRVLRELEDARAEIIESKRIVRGRVSLGVTQTPGRSMSPGCSGCSMAATKMSS